MQILTQAEQWPDRTGNVQFCNHCGMPRQEGDAWNEKAGCHKGCAKTPKKLIPKQPNRGK